MPKTSRQVARGVLAALAVLTLAGCGSSYGGSSSGGSAAGDSPATEDNTAADLSTAGSDLGKIVVDGSGRTVYVFDKDTAGSGTSACAGECLATWPAVAADSAEPAVDGVTGDVDTITRDDGTRQITLDGLPLYTYAADSHPGDVTGQGVGGIWWVVAADGAKVTGAPSPSSPSSPSPSSPSPSSEKATEPPPAPGY